MIQDPFQKLGEIRDVQQRIDAVAADLQSGSYQFASIDPWKLAELLGLDFHDHGDWAKRYYSYKHEIENSGYENPFCEYIHYLNDLVSPERYKQLEEVAEEIMNDDSGEKSDDDLSLSIEETTLIQQEYTRRKSSDPDIEVAQTYVQATDGTELFFEICIGDGGEVFDPIDPYEFEKGNVFDNPDFVEIDN